MKEDKVETEMSLLEGIFDSRTNPLAVVEDIASDNNWAFERSGEDEVTIVTKGQWTDYQLSFTWMGEIEALH
ncbi:YbjN domain-containing protein, partial [Staphylococcus aureus]|uniref:YbjN domain-containing protein n=1 Tax=Staphylococcus aureus TaxID=1280 RepID=UPI001C82C7DF